MIIEYRMWLMVSYLWLIIRVTEFWKHFILNKITILTQIQQFKYKFKMLKFKDKILLKCILSSTINEINQSLVEQLYKN